MKFFQYLFISTITLIIAFSCANIRQPTGGPVDETPPTLLRAVPKQYTTNFDQDEITLYFDEPIKTENLAQNFFISPSPEITPVVRLSKRSLDIQFQEPLEPKTTYTISFNGAIVDLHEGNPIQNLTYTFSTGPYLDSLFITGNVNDPLTNVPTENILISLYPENDTISVQEDKPKYFTYSNPQGAFALQNVKSDTYDLYAIEDKNKNMLYDQQTERIAFYKNIVLDSGVTNLEMFITRIDTAKPIIMDRDTLPEAYQLTLNEGIMQADVVTPITKLRLPNIITNNGKGLRIFNTTNIYDSLQVHIQVEDSSSNVLTDTLNIIFNQVDDKNNLLPVVKSVDPQTNRLDRNNPEISILFNYPVIKTNKNVQLQTNSNIRELTIPPTDSIFSEITVTDIPTRQDTVTLILPDSTFLSVAGHANKADTIPFTFISETEVGSIEGVVETQQENFILQLLNEEYEVIRSQTDESTFNFTALQAGTYFFRIIIDENNNEKWDQAVIEENKQPEPIIFYKDPVKVKENWEVKGINLTL